MDNLDELLEEMLSRAYSNIIYREEKIIKDMWGDRLSLKEFHTLDVINKTSINNTNTGGNIAKILGVTLSTLTINVDRLIAKGYVNKVKHDNDKRLSYISLTDSGKQLKVKYDNMHKKTVSQALSRLTQTEKVALLSAINKLEL